MQLIAKAKNYYKRAYKMGHFPILKDILLSKKRIIAYYGFLGDGNFGDELVYESTRKLAYNELLIPVQRHMPLSMKLLTRWFPKKFSGYIIGGGTLIGEHPYKKNFQILSKAKIPIYIHGVGVNKFFDVDFWKPILNNKIFGGVRGPISLNNIESINFENKILGDAAFYLYTSSISKSSRANCSRKILINFGTHTVMPELIKSRSEIEKFILKYRSKGYEFSFLPFHTHDCKIGEDLKNKYHFIELLEIPTNFKDACNYFTNCCYAIGERLHFNVMATMVGCPFLSINYNKKHLDFLKSLNITEAGIEINDVNLGVIEKKFQLNDSYFNWKEIDHKLRSYKKTQKQQFDIFISNC